MTGPPTESPPSLPTLLLLLSVTTGLVDAASVLGLGKVFTANMTGNVVFLGFAAARAPGYAAAPCLTALASFLVGAGLAGRIGVAHAGKPFRLWLRRAALLETGLLWIAALLGTLFNIATQAPYWVLYVIIALTAIAMGFRNGTVRQLRVPDLSTTVLTLTLAGLAADSSPAHGRNPHWRRRIGSVVAIFVGALLGAALVLNVGLWAPLAVAGVVIMIATLWFSSLAEYSASPPKAASI